MAARILAWMVTAVDPARSLVFTLVLIVEAGVGREKNCQLG